MKTREARFFLSVLLIGCFLPCLGRGQPLDQPGIKSDEIKPPQLLTPENGSTVNGVPEFFWTSAVVPRGFKGTYKLKVVPVSQGQDPGAALASNPPVHQASMRRTQEAYPADGPGLNNGQTYAWCVQVLDANGTPVGENLGMSDVFVFTYEGSEMHPALQGLNVTTQPLVMTGMRIGSLTVDTQPLVMTGMRVQSITVNTQPLVMTGMRSESITLTTQPLVMTGMRVGSITVNSDALKMTGIRSGQPNPPVESDKTPAKTKIQEELKKKLDLPGRKTDDSGSTSNQPPEVKEAKQKLDLPSKKQEPVDGANPPAGQPDGAQMKQGGTGKAVGDTAINRVLGKVPALSKPATPELPMDGTSGGAKTAPVSPPSGTVEPAGTGGGQGRPKLEGVKKPVSPTAAGSEKAVKTGSDAATAEIQKATPAPVPKLPSE